MVDVTKPYKIIKFGARYVTKPHEFIGFRGHGCHQTLLGTWMTPDLINLYALVPWMSPNLINLYALVDVTKPYKFIGFGAMDVTKPYELDRV